MIHQLKDRTRRENDMLTMEYSEARDTWNVFDVSTHEWIFEGTFEQCCDMVNNCNCMDE
jgi:hypothetical protein